MSQANAYEQYILELVNAERAKIGAQPLAFDGDLNESAELHSDWMLDFDVFSHTGANGSSAGNRMAAAGYSFTGSWSWAENIAWMSARSPSGWQDEALGLHTNLMNSTGHRTNILNANFREIGIGFETGDYKGYNAAMVTQNFAKTGGNPFLTGVAFDDMDGDRFYDVGEALAGVTVTVTNTATGQVLSTQAGAAGGYELELAAGTYNVTSRPPASAARRARSRSERRTSRRTGSIRRPPVERQRRRRRRRSKAPPARTLTTARAAMIPMTGSAAATSSAVRPEMTP
jgi:hypothetical protein